jgi:hypothetical protein
MACIASLACLLAAAAPQPAASEMLDLQDLDPAQRTFLYKELEEYALVTAALNYCRRPPYLEERIREVATGCVAPDALDTVATRFREHVARSTGEYDCGDARLQRLFDTAHQKFQLVVDDLKAACRYRVFYRISPF